MPHVVASTSVQQCLRHAARLRQTWQQAQQARRYPEMVRWMIRQCRQLGIQLTAQPAVFGLGKLEVTNIYRAHESFRAQLEYHAQAIATVLLLDQAPKPATPVQGMLF